MVKKIAERTEPYQCEKCGHTYPTLEKALQCESYPVAPFKYEIGNTVVYEFQSHLTHKKFTARGIVESRWIHGLSEKGEPSHGNIYKLRVADGASGLITCRFERDIIRKV